MIEKKGSFRDLAGKVFYFEDRIFRKLNSYGEGRFQVISQNNILDQSIDNKYSINTKILNSNE